MIQKFPEHFLESLAKGYFRSRFTSVHSFKIYLWCLREATESNLEELEFTIRNQEDKLILQLYKVPIREREKSIYYQSLLKLKKLKGNLKEWWIQRNQVNEIPEQNIALESLLLNHSRENLRS